MTTRYYTHFVTDSPESHFAGEYSGVVELAGPLKPQREMRELRALLARNFELAAEDIRILDWARVH
jgi:hypothetical protein